MTARLFSVLVLTLAFSLPALATGPDDDFDRMDGTGPSGMRVDVVEWQGNLEIHVYPKGGLAGLALKLDEANQDKPVMVIGYRFSNAPKKQIVRRAILGVPFREGFRAYRDPAPKEYDKIVITNGPASPKYAQFKLDAAPAQLYPEGHPALADEASAGGTESGAGEARKPAGGSDGISDDDFKLAPEDGGIRPRRW
ncbi:MAG: hypothetical protein IT285_07275 [Bdellovibrionales bacterium]|nr:hypothetical protein [Bdellovibrionales bacterium]